MRGRHTIPRKFYPVRIQRKTLRTVRGKSRRTSAGDRNDLVSIALKDLGDIDAKELNTIPYSIAEEEVLRWKDELDTKTGQRVTCPIPLFQVNSAKFCPVCTVDLVKIHENSDDCDSCNNLVKARPSFEQEVMMNLLNGLGENMPTSAGRKFLQVTNSKEKNETIRAKRQASKNQIARGIHPEDKMTCTMSELSMQAHLCSSESTISAVISEAVQTKSPLCVRLSTSDKKSKLRLLCGELLMHLCKTSAENAMIRDQTFTSSIPNSTEGSLKVPNTSLQDQKQSDQISCTAITQQFPDWLRKITREKSRRSQHDIHQKIDFSIQGNAVGNKTSSKRFKPLLCTNLSVPWKHLTQSHASFVKPQTKMNFNGQTTIYTNSNTIIKSLSSRIAVDNPNIKISEPLLNRTNNHFSRNRDLKPKQELVKRMTNEFGEPEVCSKCRGNMSSSHHSKIMIRPSKGRKHRPHKRSSKRHTRLPKEKRAKRRVTGIMSRANARKGIVPCSNKRKGTASRPNTRKGTVSLSNMRKGTSSKDSVATRYFIRSFFTETSATTPKTKSIEKTSRNATKKPDAGRKKSTFTLPHHLTVGQAGFSFTKKKHEGDGHIRQLPGKIISKDDGDILLGEELRTISKRVTAQEKRINETSAPMFHTCFKNMLSRELKNKGVHARKPTVSQKEGTNHKKPKGVGHVPAFPQKLEKRKFNEKLFSCFIPRVFK